MFNTEIQMQQEFFRSLENAGLGKADVWYGGSHKWSNKTPYDSENRIVQGYVILGNQVVFDFDHPTKEENKDAVQVIQNILADIPHVLVDTGGRGYHLYVFLTKTSDKFSFFESILNQARKKMPNLDVDEQLVKAKTHLVRAPFSYHEKTGKQTHFSNPDFSITYALPKIKLYKFNKSENKVIFTSFYCIDDVLVQQVSGHSFITYDGTTFSKSDLYSDKDVCVKPLDGEEITKGFVLLAEEPVEYGSISNLIEAIKVFSKKYIDMPEDFRTFSAYYVLLTWVYDRATTIPYLRFMGDTGCGKSRALDVFASLCYNYIPVNGAANSAPIYRVIEKWKGTLGFEESDLRKSDETNEIVKIINCGFEKGKPVIRCEKNKPNKINFFDPFCPKIFATRKPFEDAATEGRCLTHITQETKRMDIPPVLPSIFYKEAKELRNKLLCFRLKNFRKINSDVVLALPDSLEPRLKQLATPFSMVFSQNPEDWNTFVTFLFDYQKQLKEARLTSEAGTILLQLIELAVDRNEPIICKDIAATLSLPISRVSKELRSLGFATEQKHVEMNGKRKTIRAITISEDRWKTISNRYLPEPIPIPYSLCQSCRPCQTSFSGKDGGTHGADGTPKGGLDNLEEATTTPPPNSYNRLQ